eukprot:1245779-Amphidinium_carterae.1
MQGFQCTEAIAKGIVAYYQKYIDEASKKEIKENASLGGEFTPSFEEAKCSTTNAYVTHAVRTLDSVLRGLVHEL